MTDNKHEALTKPFIAVIRGICSHKNDGELVFRVSTTEEAVELTVVPHTADFPKINGKGGRQIKALKFLFERAGGNLGLDAALKLEESFVGNREESSFTENPKFNVSEMRSLIVTFAKTVMGCPVDAEINQDGNGRTTFTLKPSVEIRDAMTITAAMDEVFYPYAMAHGRRGVEVCLEKGS